MHRLAIGDPQCINHQLFAKLWIWIVDGKSVWQELYPRGCGSPGLTGCSYWRCLVEVWNRGHVDFSLEHADGRRARHGNAPAIMRCGEPVQFQLSGFLACNRAESLMGSAKGSAMGDLTNCAMME